MEISESGYADFRSQWGDLRGVGADRVVDEGSDK
jgi:hypothetical protein